VPAFVYHTAVADFLAATCDGPATVEVLVAGEVSQAVVRPVSRGLVPTVTGQRITFTLERTGNLCLDVAGQLPLFVYLNPPEREVPSPEDPTVHYFRAGRVYEAGEIILAAGETLYIEGGAVVRGVVRGIEAHGVRVCGRGILDGGWCTQSRMMIVLEGCEAARIEDIIMIHPTGWMVVLGACRDVTVSNLKQIGEVMCSDGIDIVGSSDVLIEGCCLRNNDDCVVVKALTYADRPTGTRLDWRRDVKNVMVRDCLFANAEGGNAMEIGFELRTESVSGITFRNIDVLSVHRHGAVFSIHNGDQAVVHDVLFEDIRIEHCYDKFIDFRILSSRYSHAPGQGQIRDITLRRIHWQRTPFNIGYTVSLMGGYNAEHRVERIRLEEVTLDGVTIRNLDELDLHTRHANAITLAGGPDFAALNKD
jgi:hypothetical protein